MSKPCPTCTSKIQPAGSPRCPTCGIDSNATRAFLDSVGYSDAAPTPRTDALVKCVPGSEFDNLATPTKPLIELCRQLERELRAALVERGELALKLAAAECYIKERKLASSNAPSAIPTTSHEWDRDGERCVKCGAKDWMDAPCTTARRAEDK